MPARKPQWWGTPLQSSVSELLGSCGRSNLRLRCYFGMMERNLFLMQFTEQVFGTLLQTIVKNTDSWNSLSPWEYYVENLFGEEKDVQEWKKPSMNESGRRRERDLYYIRTAVRDTKWAFELRSVAVQEMDLSQPLNMMQRGIRLRQRKTCELRNTTGVGGIKIQLHFDLLSEGVSTPASTVQERRVLLEIIHVDPSLLDRYLPTALGYFYHFVASIQFGNINKPLSAAPPEFGNGFRISSTQDHDSIEVLREAVPFMTEFHAGKGQLEFEGRIGNLVATMDPQPHYSFVPGVTRDHFYLLLERMETPIVTPETQTNKGTISSTSTWHDSLDLFWDNNLRGTKTRETTMTGNTSMQLVVKSTQRLLHVRSADRPYSFKLSLNSETKVRNDPVLRPKALWYRYKRRRSFPILEGRFRADFTIVGQGVSEEAAIRAPKVFEIEIEALLVPTATFTTDTTEMIDRLSQLLDPEEFYLDRPFRPCQLAIVRDELAFLDCETPSPPVPKL